MLKQSGDWMPLGVADEQKEAKPDTVEAWGRSADNHVGGWYGPVVQAGSMHRTVPTRSIERSNEATEPTPLRSAQATR